MGFLTGSATFLRFRVDGPPPGLFGSDHLDRLRAHAAGQSRIASADGIDCGWGAGGSVLDTDFAEEKNVYPGFLAFDFRTDADKLPADLLKAYYAAEVKAIAAGNPSGLPSARQKREAKEVARERLEQEAKDGRFRKRKCVPVLWAAATNEVLFGASSLSQVERFAMLFERTFGVKLKAVTAGEAAHRAAALTDRTRAVEDAAPSPFLPGVSPPDVSWIADESSRDFLGNEFALWLWHHLETESDTIPLGDGSEATAMISGGLTLDCPRGLTGLDTFKHEGPTRLPEAKRAAQAGKLPRKLGLIVARYGSQFAFGLDCETFGVRAAKLPPPPEDVNDTRAKAEHRLTAVVDLIDTLDRLFAVFLADRLSPAWSATTLPKVQRWLAAAERRAA